MNPHQWHLGVEMSWSGSGGVGCALWSCECRQLELSPCSLLCPPSCHLCLLGPGVAKSLCGMSCGPPWSSVTWSGIDPGTHGSIPHSLSCVFPPIWKTKCSPVMQATSQTLCHQQERDIRHLSPGRIFWNHLAFHVGIHFSHYITTVFLWLKGHTKKWDSSHVGHWAPQQTEELWYRRRFVAPQP